MPGPTTRSWESLGFLGAHPAETCVRSDCRASLPGGDSGWRRRFRVSLPCRREAGRCCRQGEPAVPNRFQCGRCKPRGDFTQVSMKRTPPLVDPSSVRPGVATLGSVWETAAAVHRWSLRSPVPAVSMIDLADASIENKGLATKLSRVVLMCSARSSPRIRAPAVRRRRSIRTLSSQSRSRRDGCRKDETLIPKITSFGDSQAR